MTVDTAAKNRIDTDLSPMPVKVHAQYIKDFSFENPGAPHTLRAGEGQPTLDVNFVLDAFKIEDEEVKDLYESSITVKVESKRGKDVLFIAEIVYAGLVSFSSLSEAQAKYILYVEVPQMLFPFARQTLINTAMAGGFPPIMLNPVDFRAMYENRLRQNKAQAMGAAVGTA